MPYWKCQKENNLDRNIQIIYNKTIINQVKQLCKIIMCCWNNYFYKEKIISWLILIKIIYNLDIVKWWL